MVPSIYIPGTTPHCLVSTEGNVTFWGTRNLVYSQPYMRASFWRLCYRKATHMCVCVALEGLKEDSQKSTHNFDPKNIDLFSWWTDESRLPSIKSERTCNIPTDVWRPEIAKQKRYIPQSPKQFFSLDSWMGKLCNPILTGANRGLCWYLTDRKHDHLEK